MLNGYVTPAIAKQRKIEPSGPSGNDNGNDYTTYFQNLVAQVSLKQLGAWLLELALIHHRDHAPYSYAGDKAVRDPLFETAKRWGVDAKAVCSAVETKSKPGQTKQTTKPANSKRSKKD